MRAIAMHRAARASLVFALVQLVSGCGPGAGADASPGDGAAPMDVLADAPGLDAPSSDAAPVDDAGDAGTAPLLPRFRLMHLIYSMQSVAIDVCMARQGAAPPTQPMYAAQGDATGLRYQDLGRFVAIEPGVYTVSVVRAGAGCDASAVLTSLLSQRFNYAERPQSTLGVRLGDGLSSGPINGTNSSQPGVDLLYFNDALVDTADPPLARSVRYEPAGGTPIALPFNRVVQMVPPGTSGALVVESAGATVLSRAFRTVDGGAVSLILSGPSSDSATWRLIVCDEQAPPDGIRTHCADDVRRP